MLLRNLAVALVAVVSLGVASIPTGALAFGHGGGGGGGQGGVFGGSGHGGFGGGFSHGGFSGGFGGRSLGSGFAPGIASRGIASGNTFVGRGVPGNATVGRGVPSNAFVGRNFVGNVPAMAVSPSSTVTVFTGDDYSASFQDLATATTGMTMVATRGRILDTSTSATPTTTQVDAIGSEPGP